MGLGSWAMYKPLAVALTDNCWLTIYQRLRRRVSGDRSYRYGYFPYPARLGAPQSEVVSSLLTHATISHRSKAVNRHRNSEIEDCTLDWTFEPESVDYIHMRWLVGSVTNWEALFGQAYRALRPGGWLESYEGAAIMESDDGSVSENSAMGQWGKIFVNFGKTIERPFTVVADGTQPEAMRDAGFVDIEQKDLKVRTPTPFIPLFSCSRLVDFVVGLDSDWSMA